MEFAAYVYDAWAYERANQQFAEIAPLTGEHYVDESQIDSLEHRFALTLVAKKWQGYLLSAIAVTGLNGFGLARPVAAYQFLEPSVNVAPWCDNLYLCNTSYVLEVQTLLAKRGFAVGELDGVYGRYTKQAVIDFQKSQKNLVVDGIPGEKTLVLLRNSSVPIASQSTEQNNPRNSQTSNPNTSQNNASDRNGQTVIVRSNNSQINNSQINNSQITASGDMGNLQILLKQRGFYQGAIDGQQGQSTTNAIVKAQRAYGLVADGFAGPLTIRALLAGGNDIALAQPMFKRSPQTQDVLEVQKLLQERGFYDEALNGLYNLQTKASIFQAQLAYAQPATGESSPELITALKAQNLNQVVAPTSSPNTTPNATPNAVPNSIPNAARNNGQANMQNNQNNQDIRPSPNNALAPSSGQNAPAPPEKSSNSS